jgi:glycerophosphoryl diester phosphodiesterase
VEGGAAGGPGLLVVRLTDGDPPRTRPVEDLIERATAIGADGLDVSADPAVTAAFVRAANAAGLPVYVWTVNDPAVARWLRDVGVAGIATDRPGWLRVEVGRTIH